MFYWTSLPTIRHGARGPKGLYATRSLPGMSRSTPIVYAETSLAFADTDALDSHLDALMLQRLALPYGAAFRAGRAILRYRRAGGTRSSPLPDFYIGAHAESQRLTLLTRDVGRYRSYFPSLTLIAPRKPS